MNDWAFSSGSYLLDLYRCETKVGIVSWYKLEGGREGGCQQNDKIPISTFLDFLTPLKPQDVKESGNGRQFPFCLDAMVISMFARVSVL